MEKLALILIGIAAGIFAFMTADAGAWVTATFSGIVSIACFTGAMT